MIPKLHGSISLSGKDLNDYKAADLASQLSVVLTENTISKNLTVEELIALGRQPYTNWIDTISKKDFWKIKRVIQIVQLENLISKKCFELSDGQLQRALIARALAQDTPLIILDEPTTHLDIYYKASIIKLLKRLAFETKKTILFSTHEIDFAIQLCDKMIVLNEDSFDFGRPKELIQCRAFSKLFPEDLIMFDIKSGTFKVRS